MWKCLQHICTHTQRAWFGSFWPRPEVHSNSDRKMDSCEHHTQAAVLIPFPGLCRWCVGNNLSAFSVNAHLRICKKLMVMWSSEQPKQITIKARVPRQKHIYWNKNIPQAFALTFTFLTCLSSADTTIIAPSDLPISSYEGHDNVIIMVLSPTIAQENIALHNHLYLHMLRSMSLCVRAIKRGAALDKFMCLCVYHLCVAVSWNVNTPSLLFPPQVASKRSALVLFCGIYSCCLPPFFPTQDPSLVTYLQLKLLKYKSCHFETTSFQVHTKRNPLFNYSFSVVNDQPCKINLIEGITYSPFKGSWNALVYYWIIGYWVSSIHSYSFTIMSLLLWQWLLGYKEILLSNLILRQKKPHKYKYHIKLLPFRSNTLQKE